MQLKRNILSVKNDRENSKFKYLRSVIANSNNITPEIRLSINMGNKYYYAFRNILRPRLSKKNKKCKIHKTLVRQAVIYEYGSWALTKIDEETTYLKGGF